MRDRAHAAILIDMSKSGIEHGKPEGSGGVAEDENMSGPEVKDTKDGGTADGDGESVPKKPKKLKKKNKGKNRGKKGKGKKQRKSMEEEEVMGKQAEVEEDDDDLESVTEAGDVNVDREQTVASKPDAAKKQEKQGSEEKGDGGSKWLRLL
jgi:hypothetical protein